MSKIDWKALPPADLADEAAAFRHDNDDGSAYFFDPEDADWRFEMTDPALLAAFSGPDEARTWIDTEIATFEADGMTGRAHAYRSMLTDGFTDPVIIGQIGSQGRLWDGWHRTAIAMVRGEGLPAIVGTPRNPA